MQPADKQRDPFGRQLMNAQRRIFVGAHGHRRQAGQHHIVFISEQAFTQADAVRGATLSAAYCIGLGLPFLLVGLGLPLLVAWRPVQRACHQAVAPVLRADGSEVRIVGIVSHIKPITTKAGKLMAIVAIEDLAGRAECTFFPEAWEQARPMVTADAIIVVSGRIEVREERGPQLLVSEVRPWEQGREQFRPALHVELRAEDITEERLAGIDEALSAFPGEAEVYLHIVRPDHSRVAMRSRRLRVGSQDGLIPRIKERAPMCRVRWGKGAS